MSEVLSGPSVSSIHRLQQLLFILLIITVIGLSVSIALSSVAFGISAALFIVLITIDKSFRVRTPLDYAVLTYCCAELLSTIFSIDKTASFINMKRLFLILIVPMTITCLRDEKNLRKILLILFGCVSVLSIFEIVSVLEIGASVVRLGVFQHYMTAGGIKMFILLLMFPFVVDVKVPRKLRMYALIGFLPVLMALILTETRSSWLGLLTGVAIYGLMRNRKVLIGLVVAVALFMIIAPQHLKDRAFSIFDMHHYSNVDRFNKWIAGSRMVMDYPILGTGDIDLGQIYAKYKEPTDASEGGHLHNNFMMLIVTLGIAGLLATLYLFVKILLAELEAVIITKNSWLLGNISVGCLSAYGGFHINGLFEWNFGDHEIAVLLWFTVGLALTSMRLFNSQSTESAA